MIEYFAAHKAVLLIGMAALSLALVLRHRGAAQAGSLPAYPVSPYSSTPPAEGGSLALPALGPVAGAGAAVGSGAASGTGGGGGGGGDSSAAAAASFENAGPSVSDASTSSGPGAGPTLASPTMVSVADYSGQPSGSAFGLIGGDVPSFVPQAAYNPIYTPAEPVYNFGGIGTVGITGTITSPDLAYDAPRQIQNAAGAVALIDPSGHVVNVKGARVGGVAGD